MNDNMNDDLPPPYDQVCRDSKYGTELTNLSTLLPRCDNQTNSNSSFEPPVCSNQYMSEILLPRTMEEMEREKKKCIAFTVLCFATLLGLCLVFVLTIYVLKKKYE
ncbi:hypothetical protein MRV_0040 [Murid herpesvirus 3]|uniref:Uncharacterized protein n=2 Tax=Murid betaherpesvirus 3 TaxID=2560603 RepID=A0A1P8VIT1_9BETA|nr:hypothetical protein MRV_0040 [Murine roseolovirus]APZ76251.1 hypothetical protein MRV_0040 [Murid betaherpesvirus 3]AYH64819.1 hypothetical protein MRV_0040 [Murid herpesvirus 3]